MKTKIINSHTHYQVPETVTSGFYAGKIGLTPDEVQIAEFIFEKIPGPIHSKLQKVLNLLSDKPVRIQNFLKTIFQDSFKEYLWNYIQVSGGTTLPIFLDVFPSEYPWPASMRCFSASVLPPEGSKWLGCKWYPKLLDWPSEEVFQYCNDNELVIIFHCSRGGIWSGPSHGGFFQNPFGGGGLSPFKSEADANKAVNPLRILGVAQRYPNIRWIMSHAGGRSEFVKWGMYLAGKIPKPENNLTEDCLSVIELLGDRACIGTGCHEQSAEDDYLIAAREIGWRYPDNIVYESDFPFNLIDDGSEGIYQSNHYMAYESIWDRISWDTPKRMWRLQLGDIMLMETFNNCKDIAQFNAVWTAYQSRSAK